MQGTISMACLISNKVPLIEMLRVKDAPTFGFRAIITLLTDVSSRVGESKVGNLN